MTRPHDISQAIWRAAQECYADLPIVYDGWDEDAVIMCIARALSDAYARGIEDAAKLLEENHTVYEGKPADWNMLELINAIRALVSK